MHLFLPLVCKAPHVSETSCSVTIKEKHTQIKVIITENTEKPMNIKQEKVSYRLHHCGAAVKLDKPAQCLPNPQEQTSRHQLQLKQPGD